MLKLPATFTVLILLIAPIQVLAFTFEFIGIKDPVHTDMAIQALNCAVTYPDDDSVNCETLDSPKQSPTLHKSAVNPITVTEDDIYYGVIWADDPLRELRKRKLHRVLLWTFRLTFDQCKDLQSGLPDGIRCTAHYGNMQFMHAMEGENAAPASKTQEAILDWIEFAYKVALNDTLDNSQHFRTTLHCDYFNAESPSKLQQSMIPNGVNRFPCGELERPWTVGTIFSFNCWFRSETCLEFTHENAKTTRIAALGAILHTIQDSFAKGHTSRGNDSLALLNQIECAPIAQFQNYKDQDHDTHGDADEMPLTYSETCFNADGSLPSIHGPITASAQVLRIFKNHADPAKLRQYLKEHVFVLTDDAKPAGSTDLMAKN